MTVSGVGKCRQVTCLFFHSCIGLLEYYLYIWPLQWWCRCNTHGIVLYVQVGIPESGIDDAVQKLVARG